VDGSSFLTVNNPLAEVYRQNSLTDEGCELGKRLRRPRWLTPEW
jgi:hypothetical protein